MKRIAGIFSKETQALRAIERLRTDGYRDDEISVITSDKENYDRLSRVVGDDVMSSTDIKAENAGEKAASGSVIGGIGGFLLGLGAMAVPGAGPVLAAGPIAGAITGAVAGGTIGGVAGLLTDYGIPEEEARQYEERITEGDIMILVDDDEERREAVYDNFYENESYIRDGYRKGDPGLNLDEDKVDLNDPLNDPRRLL
ncbi:general stress protein [Proteiniclasticum sp. SCR006]|uniref:General stress protein n=1 Tax=Proteiniclasticum aestuarii TaxID=2817862 RepID=A0A939KFG3_9CLOT|nr:general stress protein [Proteiniclasticum aestuarii]MBO1264432.1 general stress protein [Proteiniclasticum aestuarii]